MTRITLNNGVKMPLVGLGTYQLSSEDAQASTTYALDNGYELIDTANFYVNERGVGRGMRASSKAREDIFLETKIWPSSYESETAVEETLERLGTDYIDLLLLHQYAGDIRTGYVTSRRPTRQVRSAQSAFQTSPLRDSGVSSASPRSSPRSSRSSAIPTSRRPNSRRS